MGEKSENYGFWAIDGGIAVVSPAVNAARRGSAARVSAALAAADRYGPHPGREGGRGVNRTVRAGGIAGRGLEAAPLKKPRGPENVSILTMRCE
jgi:hypothetical protein